MQIGLLQKIWYARNNTSGKQILIMKPLYNIYFCHITIIKWFQNCTRIIMKCFFGEIYYLGSFLNRIPIILSNSNTINTTIPIGSNQMFSESQSIGKIGYGASFTKPPREQAHRWRLSQFCGPRREESHYLRQSDHSDLTAQWWQGNLRALVETSAMCKLLTVIHNEFFNNSHVPSIASIILWHE